MNVIETRALGKSYGSTRALRDCTLAIPDGHVVALVGPNGAGKSTLLNLAVGLATPSAGEVPVLGGLPAGSPPALDGGRDGRSFSCSTSRWRCSIRSPATTSWRR